MSAGIFPYREDLLEAVRRIDDGRLESAIAVLSRAREDGNKVFSIGNGGSAATASHFAGDLAKNTKRAGCRPFRAISLVADLSLVTAYGNDEGFDRIFAAQLESLASLGDVLVAISASGNSENIISAVSAGKERGAIVIGLSGFDGGRLSGLSDVSIHVCSRRYELVEDVHGIVLHSIVSWFRHGGEHLSV
jgi:D-sedoheptulose 7-phosphate isomerase